MAVLVRPDFIDGAEVARLRLEFKQRTQAGQGQDFAQRTQLPLPSTGPTILRAVKNLRDFYEVEIEAEPTTMLVEMREGDSQPQHADAEAKDSEGGWGPNHTPWRTHVALIYLSTAGREHDGGALTLPGLGLRYECEAGLMIGFPATREYLHGVAPVERGARLVMATWTKAHVEGQRGLAPDRQLDPADRRIV